MLHPPSTHTSIWWPALCSPSPISFSMALHSLERKRWNQKQHELEITKWTLLYYSFLVSFSIMYSTYIWIYFLWLKYAVVPLKLTTECKLTPAGECKVSVIQNSFCLRVTFSGCLCKSIVKKNMERHLWRQSQGICIFKCPWMVPVSTPSYMPLI